MSNITKTFNACKRNGQKGFIPFITAGDPDLDTSLEVMIALAELGADIIELGVPFSDPMADGPTIQLSSQRALRNGVNLARIFELVEQFRSRSDVPIVLFSYLNPLLRFGLEKLAETAESIGINGVLITDVVDSEARQIADSLEKRNIDLISLIAPTTSDTRLRSISQMSSGFIYAVSRAGVTGARTEVSSAAEILVSRMRSFTELPIAVGFGISTREQVSEVWRFADAAVVGSAIVKEIERSVETGNTVERVREFVGSLLP